MLVLPIAGGILLGRLIDNLLGIQPYATAGLFLLGLTIALAEVYRAMNDALEAIRRA